MSHSLPRGRPPRSCPHPLCRNVTLVADEFITLAAQPAGMDGALLYTFVDASSADPNYLEGGWVWVGGERI